MKDKNVYYIKIKRCASAEAKPYMQIFSFEGTGDETVADALQELNCRPELMDITNGYAEKIVWECSCQEKKCGACAMRINGVPKLACSTFLRDAAKKKNIILLEPLSKFPLVKDLKVDRSILSENLKRMKVWLSENGAVQKYSKEQHLASNCIMCGCCVEVCPHFKTRQSCAGAAFVVSAYKFLTQEELEQNKQELIAKYKTNFFLQCGKSLSCQDICPMNIPIDQLMVKANAIAVWNKLE